MKNTYRAIGIIITSVLIIGVVVLETGIAAADPSVPFIGGCEENVSLNPTGDYSITWGSILLNTTATSTPSTPQYVWSGSDGLGGNGPAVQKLYSGDGSHTASVSITVFNRTATYQCGAQVTNRTTGDPHEAMTVNCVPTITGMTVRWDGTASGGVATTTYAWTMSDGFATDSPKFEQTYGTEGIKTGTLHVQSGNQIATVNCQAEVASTTLTGSSHCFIATAAYGTPDEDHVMVLRHFRDETLLANPVGRAFVSTYYAVSPPIADFIRDKEPLKAVVRAGLDPIVAGLEKMGYTQ